MTSNGEELPKKLQLYSMYFSPPSFSVRAALNFKGIDYEYKPVDLFKGEQFRPEFLEINPMGYVPAIIDGDIVLADASAILMYLEEMYPQHPLLPDKIQKKAINFQAANIVTTSIQPLIRIPILWYIAEKVSDDEKIDWVHKHLGKAFKALEKLLKDHAGKYATGDEISLADIFLAPYVIGYPKEQNFDMSGYPLLSRLAEAYKMVPSIQAALPENQPDFPPVEKTS